MHPKSSKRRVPVRMESCYFGPGAVVDVDWLHEVRGLKHVHVKGVRFDSPLEKEELLPLLEGRAMAVIVGCRICECPISGDPGAPDVCPDELSFRCVLSA